MHELAWWSEDDHEKNKKLKLHSRSVTDLKPPVTSITNKQMVTSYSGKQWTEVLLKVVHEEAAFSLPLNNDSEWA